MPARPLCACVWSLLLLTAMPQVAWSHASLQQINPANGTVLADPPAEIILHFNEPVSPVRLQLLDGDGVTIPLADRVAPGNVLSFAPVGELADGQYVFSYRVLSADAHPISGSVGFAIGDMPAPIPDEVSAGTDSVLLGLVRSVRAIFLATLLAAIGMAVYPALFIEPAPLSGWRRKWLAISCLTAMSTAVLGLGLWGVLLAEGTPFNLLQGETWTLANSTTLARSTAIAMLGLTIVLMSTWSQPGRFANLFAGAGVLIAVGGMVSSGHAAGTGSLLLAPVFMIHILMAGIWFGSLWMLLSTLGRSHGTAVAEVLTQFSPRATLIVILLLACAGLLGWYQLGGSIDGLTGSDYGKWLLLKTALVGIILLFAVLNRWYFTPAFVRDGEPARPRLLGSIRAETLFMLTVIALTTVLASTPPPEKVVPRTSFTVHSTADPNLVMTLSIAPAVEGTNTVELTFQGAAGMLTPQEVSLRWDNEQAGIEPLQQKAVQLGDGTYRLDNVNLLLPGNWQFRAEALIDDFTVRNFETSITIR